MKSLYLIGSLRNSSVSSLASQIRGLGFDVFDDWFAAGPEADDYWQKYEQDRGHSYSEALKGYAARHVFEFDKAHLIRCDIAVLVLPAGRSGHLELGWFLGKGKPGYILLEGEPDRFDVMYSFANGVFNTKEELFAALQKELNDPRRSLYDLGITPASFAGSCDSPLCEEELRSSWRFCKKCKRDLSFCQCV